MTGIEDTYGAQFDPRVTRQHEPGTFGEVFVDGPATLAELVDRVTELERLAAGPPAVVVRHGEVLVITGPADVDDAWVANMRANVEAMGLGGRVVILRPELVAHIERRP